MELNIQQLNDIVGGRLRLADMPPLGGVWEPLGKVVTAPEQISDDDVLLVLPELWQQDPCCVAQAFDCGAAGVISVGKPIEPWAGRFSVNVNDAHWALWQLARATRNEFSGQVIAVAGTIGKTITCAMIDAVLGAKPIERATSGLGNPLAEQMLRLDDESPLAVLEVHGETVADLDGAAHLCCPHVSVFVNSVGATGSEDVHGNCWTALCQALPDDGVTILGTDGNSSVPENSANDVLTFGRHGSCDIAASHVLCEDGQLTFVVDGQIARLNVWGRHHLESALAAWGVGRAMGIAECQIAQRLEQVVLPSHRCHVTQHSGITFIDDTASRSPLARQARFELLHSLTCRGQRVVVCDASEGDESFARQSGRDVVAVGGGDYLFATGPHRNEVIRGAIDAGMRSDHCLRCRDSEVLLKKLSTFLASGDIVLLGDVDADLAQRLLASFNNAPHRAAA